MTNFNRWLALAALVVGGAPLLQSQQCGQPITTNGPDYLSYWNLPPSMLGGDPQAECGGNTAPGTQIPYTAGSFTGSCSLPWITPSGAAQWFTQNVGLGDRIPGVDWGRNGRTLVLAISTQCHFCKESAPFYRKLKAEAGKNLRIVAVVPQPAAEAARFLKGEGVLVDQVEQAGLGSIGIGATPTMLLVDRAGVVVKTWVGKIQPEQEQQVLAALRRG